MTPKLGKRKRTPQSATGDNAEDDEVDELSPDRDPDNAPSVEKPRRAALPVSPIREEENDLVDELSPEAGNAASARGNKGALASARKIPTPAISSTAATPTNAPGSSAVLSSVRGRRKSTSSGPVTPATRAGNQKRPTPKTPRVEEDADESPDELTPAPADAPTVRSKTNTPRTNTPSVIADPRAVDELSPERIDDPQPQSVPATVLKGKGKQVDPIRTSTPDVPRRPGMPHKVVSEERGEDIIQASPAQKKPRRISNTTADEEAEQTSESINAPEPAKSRKRGRPRRVVAEEDDDAEVVPSTSQATSIANKPTPSASAVQEEEDGADELSPDVASAKEKSRAGWKRTHVAQVTSEAPPDQPEDKSAQQTVEAPDSSTRRAPSAHRQLIARKDSVDKPPKKRQKRGPTQAVQVMRLEGSGTRELTVVDTTRQILEQWTAQKIEKMTNKLGRLTGADAAHARRLRQQRNVVLAYKDEIEDVLLGLQDANDTGSHRAVQYKRAYRENKQLRDEVCELEKERQKIALENDEATEAFLRKKEELVTRDKLNNSLYDIESAIRNGKEKARREGRENEGPELSLKMMLEDVGMNFGSRGLLSRIKGFNGFLGKAAGIFEGKA